MSEEREQQCSGECLCMGAGPAFTKFAKAFAPPEEAASHFRQARIEFLKGIRQLIDQKIDHLERPPAEPKGSKITVE